MREELWHSLVGSTSSDALNGHRCLNWIPGRLIRRSQIPPRGELNQVLHGSISIVLIRPEEWESTRMVVN
jgi:hypothetical protein